MCGTMRIAWGWMYLPAVTYFPTPSPEQYRRRWGVSLPCSRWERVGPPRSNHQEVLRLREYALFFTTWQVYFPSNCPFLATFTPLPGALIRAFDTHNPRLRFNASAEDRFRGSWLVGPYLQRPLGGHSGAPGVLFRGGAYLFDLQRHPVILQPW